MAIRPFIVGNWKMHGTRAMLSEARAIDRAAQRLILLLLVTPPAKVLDPGSVGTTRSNVLLRISAYVIPIQNNLVKTLRLLIIAKIENH